jgi:hypothetical protein
LDNPTSQIKTEIMNVNRPIPSLGFIGILASMALLLFAGYLYTQVASKKQIPVSEFFAKEQPIPLVVAGDIVRVTPESLDENSPVLVLEQKYIQVVGDGDPLLRFIASRIEVETAPSYYPEIFFNF